MRQLKLFPDKTVLGFAASFGVSIVFLSAMASSAASASPKRKSETEAAFDGYVRLTEERNAAELKSGSNFLWIDQLSEEQRKGAYASLRAGTPRIEKRETRDGGKEIRCPNGMIHHWEAISYIPGANVDDVLRILEDYDHHSEYYKPDV